MKVLQSSSGKADFHLSLQALINEERHRMVIQNLVQYGKGENILFMGAEHKIYFPEDEFQVYKLRIGISKDKIVVIGKIPDLQKKMHELAKKEGFTYLAI